MLKKATTVTETLKNEMGNQRIILKPFPKYTKNFPKNSISSPTFQNQRQKLFGVDFENGINDIKTSKRQ